MTQRSWEEEPLTELRVLDVLRVESGPPVTRNMAGVEKVCFRAELWEKVGV